MWNSKRNDTNELTYKTENKFLVARKWGRMGGRDSQGVWEGRTHTDIFKMDNQKGRTVQHMELCSILSGSLDGRRVQGRMETCIYIAESLRCSPENITTLLIGYTPIQNKNFKKRKKEPKIPNSLIRQALRHNIIKPNFIPLCSSVSPFSTHVVTHTQPALCSPHMLCLKHLQPPPPIIYLQQVTFFSMWMN